MAYFGSALVFSGLLGLWALVGQPSGRLGLWPTGLGTALFAGSAVLLVFWPVTPEAFARGGSFTLKANLLRRTLGVSAVPSYMVLIAYMGWDFPRAHRLAPFVLLGAALTLASGAHAAWTVTTWNAAGLERRTWLSTSKVAWADVRGVDRLGSAVLFLLLTSGERWRLPARWDGIPQFSAELLDRVNTGALHASDDVRRFLESQAQLNDRSRPGSTGREFE